MRVERALRTLLGVAALFCVVVIAGCGGVTQSTSGQGAVVPRTDWGESLLAGGAVGAGQYPAKFSFDVTAAPDCVNDYVAYNTSLAGSGTSANIVAFNNLYTTQAGTCLGSGTGPTGPQVYWAYNTGTGKAVTSVVLSPDGTEVAFVENPTSGAAVLRVLKWKALEGTTAIPATVDMPNFAGSALSTCPAADSCMASLAFENNQQDTNSAPFYVRDTDTIYVGDNDGQMHKFTNVFNGVAAENCASGCPVFSAHWPITVNSTANTILTGPVYDTVSNNLFVGDSTGLLSYIMESNSSVGMCTGATTVPCLGSTTQTVLATGDMAASVVDAPVVDPVTQRVLAFSSNETTTAGTVFGTVLQANTALALTGMGPFGIGGGSSCGPLSNPNPSPGCPPIYSGAFDNAYFTSVGAGHMYVCGADPARSDRPAIYQLTFDSSGNLTSQGSPIINLVYTSSESCSPVTEIYNTGTSTDWIFFSVGDRVNNTNFDVTGVYPDPIPTGSNCYTYTDTDTNDEGCIMSINVTTPPTPWASAVVTNAISLPALSTSVYGGLHEYAPSSTSGIVVDNVATGPGTQTSNIYFSLQNDTTGAGSSLTCNGTSGVGCAVKLTQSTLE